MKAQIAKMNLWVRGLYNVNKIPSPLDKKQPNIGIEIGTSNSQAPSLCNQTYHLGPCLFAQNGIRFRSSNSLELKSLTFTLGLHLWTSSIARFYFIFFLFSFSSDRQIVANQI